MEEKTKNTDVIELEPITKENLEASTQENDKNSKEDKQNSQEDVSIRKNDDSKLTSEVPSNEDLQKSLHESLESTPHTVVIKEDPEANENKGTRRKKWIPILCLVAIFLLVVVVVSATQTNKSKRLDTAAGKQ